MTKKIKTKPEEHTCPLPKGCGRSLPYTTEYFHKNGQQKWGLHVYCKECRRKKRNTADARKTAKNKIKHEEEQG